LPGLIFGTAIAALARRPRTSVLAPDDPARRLVGYDDATAQWLSSHLVWGGRLFGAFLALRALHRTIGAPEAVDIALRMLFALSIGALLVHLLVRARDTEDEAEPQRRIPGMRLLAWVVVALLAGALLAGYARFASFAAGRVVFTVTLVATLYLLLIVTDAAINRTMSAGLGGRTQARAPARHRSAPARPDRQADLGHRRDAVRADRHCAGDRPLGVAAADLIEAVKGVALGIRIGDFNDLVRRGVRRHRAVPVVVGLTRLCSAGSRTR
jgi:small-conductance mechanosensitive channel